MRIPLATVAVLVCALPAAAQAPAGTDAEGPAVGLFLGPAIDGSNPWFFTGFRVTVPISRKTSLDLESSALHGTGQEFARLHGWFAVQIRFMRTPHEAVSRYTIAGVAAMPGDKLRPDGSILERRLYSAAILGIGQRQLLARGLRLSTEASVHGGDGFGARAVAIVQWGRHHSR